MGKNLAIKRFIISAYLIAYFIRKEKKMQESRFDRLKRFSEIFLTARINAGRSQDWMSKELGISRKTVQNWESGISSPDFFDAIEWFRVLNMNPFPYFIRYMHPEKTKDVKSSSDDEKIEAVFNSIMSDLNIREKRALLYLFYGEHGSSPYSVLQMMLAHLHVPIVARISNAVLIKATYETNQQIGTLICKDNIQPDLDNFTNAINEASLAAVKHCEGYVNFRIEE